MRFVKEHHETQFGGGTHTTPAFDSYVRKTRNEFKKVFSDIASKIKIRGGHFYWSGFLTRKRDGLVVYFCVSDVRFSREQPMMVRTAKNYKDYTGGHNQWVNIDADFEENFRRKINSIDAPFTGNWEHL